MTNYRRVDGNKDALLVYNWPNFPNSHVDVRLRVLSFVTEFNGQPPANQNKECIHLIV